METVKKKKNKKNQSKISDYADSSITYNLDALIVLTISSLGEFDFISGTSLFRPTHPLISCI
jgi:hypothetical protein